MKPHSCGHLPASQLRRALRHIPLVAISALGALLAATPVPADEIAEQWVVRYNGPANNYDKAVAVTVDGNGNAIVTGSSISTAGLSDYYTAKYAAVTGALLWEKRYNGLFNDMDIPVALALDASGNVFVTGYSKTTFDKFGNHFDYYTAKYAAADGALLWEKTYVGLVSRDDFASAITVDSSGNAIVTGNTENASFQKKSYTAKYAALDGALLWEQYGPASPDPEMMAVDGNDNVVVAGSSTTKYAAADGVVLWTKTSPAPAAAVAIDGGGDVIVAGLSYASGHPTAFMSKYAATDGALLWAKALANTVIRGVALDGSGNIAVVGYTGNGNTSSYYTAKYAIADGAVVWEQSYHGPGTGQDTGDAVAVDGSGNVFVTGSSVGSSGGYEYYTAAYAGGNGALLWEKRLAGPATFNTSKGLASTPDGGVVVTGFSDSSTSSSAFNFDFATVKYAPADTETHTASTIGITVAKFNGTANRGGLATSVRYEWGTTPALGNLTAEQDIGAGFASLSVPVPISGLSGGETIYFRIRTENSAGIKYGATLSFTTYTSFTALQTWKFAHFGDAAVADAADPEGDGIVNIVEYALNMPPETPGIGPAVDVFDYAEGRRLRMLVARDPAHDDVTVAVQAAAFPNGPWTSVATSTLGSPFTGPGYVGGDDAGPGVKTVEIRDAVNVSEAALRFMRVQVTHPSAGGAAPGAVARLRKIALPRKGPRIPR